MDWHFLPWCLWCYSEYSFSTNMHDSAAVYNILYAYWVLIVVEWGFTLYYNTFVVYVHGSSGWLWNNISSSNSTGYCSLTTGSPKLCTLPHVVMVKHNSIISPRTAKPSFTVQTHGLKNNVYKLHPYNHFVTLSSSVSGLVAVDCSATGYPEPSYSWKVMANGKDIGDSCIRVKDYGKVCEWHCFNMWCWLWRRKW